MSSKSSSSITQSLKPTSLSEETANIKRLFSFSKWQIFVLFGIAISGLAAFVNTYDAWSGITTQLQSCTSSSNIQSELNTQFIVIIVLSCVAIVLGLFLAWLFRGHANQRRLITLGITLAGFFGIVYALSVKFQNATNKVRLTVSWLSFIGFLIWGYFISNRTVLATVPGASAQPLTGEVSLSDLD